MCVLTGDIGINLSGAGTKSVFFSRFIFPERT